MGRSVRRRLSHRNALERSGAPVDWVKPIVRHGKLERVGPVSGVEGSVRPESDGAKRAGPLARLVVLADR